MPGIERVGVIGAGTMGAAVAEACARAERDVLVVERCPATAAAGRERVLRSLDRAVRAGRLSSPERERAAWRLRWSTDTGELADRDLVIEAVPEDRTVKSRVLGAVCGVLKDDDAIDAGMRVGCAHPMGPLELADPVRLDTVRTVAEAMHAEYREPRFVPPISTATPRRPTRS
ncbi:MULTISPECIES: 3-hydroxyacyl-CoA dehydrogenase NAD-binding domain-containing protein [Pseudonocardia]|uniref:3-hydroxybutyryl-CoA dehydrogenase n=2 Tax=Pseudonocardia TaxID=1847 RepID=A0A1Y2N9C2_PSEAH|nr:MULTISPECIES: 3-hydroxyacyl-CoA dehydrogenase NAD-binding domain-containing protein [Pseudonocardia]OSY44076.1 3-hydroxybutyryl-CoA dehydrogenase [Pseudonocardia autotrophica]TDN74195.1 3-hydroxyacyl-CoA dehydrogenase-like protein [Pseudonocardia autotrophica]BBG04953.1 hypothetical protein Pdca_61620 [Pseudonocardia autotrophica]GEC23609.1 hypothetical protein PSA01_06380 [Pseudonocardia saturnea]